MAAHQVHSNSLCCREFNNNALVSLPDNIFASIVNVQYLYIYQNRLTELQPTLFRGLAQASDVFVLCDNWSISRAGSEFFGNQLTSVPAGLLDGLTSIFNLFAFASMRVLW